MAGLFRLLVAAPALPVVLQGIYLLRGEESRAVLTIVPVAQLDRAAVS